MKTYDVIFILDDKKLEDGGDGFAKDVTALIKNLGGTVTAKNVLGRKTFTYPIKKHTAGLYLQFIVEMEPGKVPLFEDKYHLNTTVLRLKVYLYEEATPARKMMSDVLGQGPGSMMDA